MGVKRHVDRDLCAAVRKLPCVACGRTPGGEAHHVTTRKASGPDTPENLMPLCTDHHYALHYGGYRKAMESWPGIRVWLELAGRDEVIARAYK